MTYHLAVIQNVTGDRQTNRQQVVQSARLLA